MSVIYPRLPPRRGSPAATWWGKAWGRSLEEAAYGEAELRRGRQLARAGAVGAISVEPGRYVAAVRDTFTVTGTVEPFDVTSAELFVEVVASGAGRVAALLSGELPAALVEGCEEVGVELVPYAGELGWTCTCEAWLDPCEHGLAVAVQVGWLMQSDPLVLLHLRGLPREELLARVHAAATGTGGAVDSAEEDLATGLDAALRAANLIGDAEAGWGPT